jgi:hypothetical protein
MTHMDDTAGAVDATQADEVREAVAQRLLKARWRPLYREPVGPIERGAFSIPVSGEFAATVWVLPWVVGELHGPQELFVVALAGLDYVPAREMTTALVGRSYSGLVLKEPRQMISLSDGGEAGRATDRLVRFASDVHGRWRDDADLDTVLGMLSRGEAAASMRPTAVLEGRPGHQREERTAVIAALLAAGGRHDEAARALSSFSVPADDTDLTSRRFARQVARWIDGGGALTVPVSPPQWGSRRPSGSPLSSGGDWSAHRRFATERRAAIDSVGPLSSGKRRGEVRSLLEAEFNKRQLSVSPRSVERDVDALLEEQRPYGKLRVAARGIRAIAALTGEPAAGGGLARVLADAHVNGGELLANRLALPERAAYPIYASGNWNVAVKIDGEATRLLDDILWGRKSGSADVVPVRIWLSVSPSANSVDVHIGNERVGSLHRDVMARFAGPIAAADERDEAPWTDARLVRRAEKPLHVLELALPEPVRPQAFESDCSQPEPSR